MRGRRDEDFEGLKLRDNFWFRFCDDPVVAETMNEGHKTKDRENKEFPREWEDGRFKMRIPGVCANMLQGQNGIEG